MDIIEFKEKLINLFPNYEFNEISDLNTIFGTKLPKVSICNQFHYKDNEKNEIKVYDRYMFISGEMYPNTDKNFIYAKNYTSGTKRNYHCRTWYDVELFKDFVSGKTYDELFDNIVKCFYNGSSDGSNTK